MDTRRSSSASSRHISVDWSLIAITAVAVALLVVTTIRTGPEPVPGAPIRVGGLEVLGADQTLVAFEDFSFGAQGWTTQAASDGDSAGIFGPFYMGAIEKRYVLPNGTEQVRLGFDLHLTDSDAAEAVSVHINGDPVIEAAAPLNGSNAGIRRGTSGAYTVWILLDEPGDAVSLQVEAMSSQATSWAIDNVSVIATAPTL